MLFIVEENQRLNLLIRQYLDRIESMQDRIDYLEESLYEFY